MYRLCFPVLALFLATSAQAFQYMQCSWMNDGRDLSFVVSLGHEGGDTLFIKSEDLYPEPLPGYSDLMPLEAIAPDGEGMVKWQTEDEYYRYQVSYGAQVMGTNADDFVMRMRIIPQWDQENEIVGTALCFSRMHENSF